MLNVRFVPRLDSSIFRSLNAHFIEENKNSVNRQKKWVFLLLSLCTDIQLHNCIVTFLCPVFSNVINSLRRRTWAQLLQLKSNSFHDFLQFFVSVSLSRCEKAFVRIEIFMPDLLMVFGLFIFLFFSNEN